MRRISGVAQAPATGTALVYLGTSWCRYCGMTSKALTAASDALAGIEVLHVDGDDEPDALAEVGAKTYPQLVLLRDGKIVAQRESADEPTLRAWLAQNGVQA